MLTYLDGPLISLVSKFRYVCHNASMFCFVLPVLSVKLMVEIRSQSSIDNMICP